MAKFNFSLGEASQRIGIVLTPTGEGKAKFVIDLDEQIVASGKYAFEDEKLSFEVKAEGMFSG